MASSASGQNFLRLLFGGAQRGLDQSFQRQGQNTNLALQLRQMLNRQQEFGRRTDFDERALEQGQSQFETNQSRLRLSDARQADHADQGLELQRDASGRAERGVALSEKQFAQSLITASANRARQGNRDIGEMFNTFKQNTRDQANLTSLIKLRDAQASSFRATAASKESGISVSQAQKVIGDYDKLVADYKKKLLATNALGMTAEQVGLEVPPSFEEFRQQRLNQIVSVRSGVGSLDNTNSDGTVDLGDLSEMSDEEIAAMLAGDQ